MILFGHLGDGNVHVNLLGADPDDVRVDEAVIELVLDCGGTISAEHGVGVAKAAWLERARGRAEVAAMRAIKRALDPAGVLNPGAVLAGSAVIAGRQRNRPQHPSPVAECREHDVIVDALAQQRRVQVTADELPQPGPDHRQKRRALHHPSADDHALGRRHRDDAEDAQGQVLGLQ